ncbi:MAG: hypothetical protein OMM_02878 [Candidatus Magnetoglobus multicellularis str. Araruama]|uniref:Fibronectin type-III domain-containing protein n=1 Tax=Candidatus Magnetoglobus multicellularis str. Araruama TaxID=890399 RepID=A0A1V1P806_9BACT|nr:MAG: hypothetical protein OMM_02878 [Candidatus Magnetoglobus multicellularis str. Araruama]
MTTSGTDLINEHATALTLTAQVDHVCLISNGQHWISLSANLEKVLDDLQAHSQMSNLTVDNTAILNTIIGENLALTQSVIANAASVTELTVYGHASLSHIVGETVFITSTVRFLDQTLQLANTSLISTASQSQQISLPDASGIVLVTPDGHITDGSITSQKIADHTISGDDIASQAVDYTHIASGAITDEKLNLSSIHADTIVLDDFISAHSAQLTSLSVYHLATMNTLSTNDLLITDTVSILDESIQLSNTTMISTATMARVITLPDVSGIVLITPDGQITDGSITSVKIADATITGIDLAANAVNYSHIASGAVTDDKLNLSAIEADTLTLNELLLSDTASFTKLTVDQDATILALSAESLLVTENVRLLNDAITISNTTLISTATQAQTISLPDASGIVLITPDGQIVDGSITSQKITDKTITGSDLSASAVDYTHIASGAVTDDKLNLSSIHADSITLTHSISANDAAYSLLTVYDDAKLNTLSAETLLVTDTVQFTNESITLSNTTFISTATSSQRISLPDASGIVVITPDGQITDGSITSEKIADATISGLDLSDNAVDYTHIAAGAITDDKLNISDMHADTLTLDQSITASAAQLISLTVYGVSTMDTLSTNSLLITGTVRLLDESLMISNTHVISIATQAQTITIPDASGIVLLIPDTGQNGKALISNGDGTFTWGTVASSGGSSCVSVVTADTTLTSDDCGIFQVSGNTTLTLPDPSTVSGQNIIINKTDVGNVVTVLGNINGQPDALLEYQYNYISLISDGIGYYIVGENREQPNTIPPTVGGSGQLYIMTVAANSVTLTWIAASDDETSQSSLRYCVYTATTNTIQSVNDIYSNGTAVSSWASGITSVVAENLSGGTLYYFNVLVRDSSGNQSAYNAISETTLIFADSGIVLDGIDNSSVIWGDYDNDGDPDLLLNGQLPDNSGLCKIYTNDGTGGFSDSGIVLPDVYYSSVAWGDYDNDNDLDLLITGETVSGNISVIYENNGAGGFSEASGITLTAIRSSAVAFGDYDNDSDKDILMAGYDDSQYVSKIYSNMGSGDFQESGISLVGVGNGPSVDWGDYDNDGDLDILLTGMGGSRTSKVYQNNGNGGFSDSGISLPGVYLSAASWGDYDQDGFLDILLTGDTSSGRISKIYRNNQAGGFSEALSLSGVAYSSSDWGDYDNDGDMDILIAGRDVSDNQISRVYTNMGSGTFQESSLAVLPGVENASVSWTDYDNDGDLDLLISGKNAAGTKITKIYKNALNSVNTAPSAPQNLSQTVSGLTASLSWSASSDAETSYTGLTYNIRMGSSPGGTNIVSPMAITATGQLLIPKTGHIQTCSYTLSNLPTGTYYWSVQSVDNGLKGSAFGSEQSFVIIDNAPTISGDTSLYSTVVSSSSVSLTWVAATDDISLPSALEYRVYSSTSDNMNSLTDTENNGTPIGNWESGIGSKTITGLSRETLYYFSVIVRDSGGNKALYDTIRIFITIVPDTESPIPGDGGTLNASNAGSSGFVLAWTTASDNQTSLLNLQYRVYISTSNNMNSITDTEANGTAFGNWESGITTVTLSGLDMGTLYFVTVITKDMTGNKAKYNTISETTTSLFSDSIYILPPLLGASVAWGDYDSDGDYDIVLSGDGYFCSIYVNDGAGNLTYSSYSMPNISSSCVSWVDYDNDGDLDLLVLGSEIGTGVTISSLHINSGGGNLSETETSIDLFKHPNFDLGDYDNDGNVDLLISGFPINLGIVGPKSTYLYRNNGTGSFVNSNESITGTHGPLSFIDHDNDHDLDFIIAGTGNTVEFYENNGTGNFSGSDFFSEKASESAIIGSGDYNNDGYLDILIGTAEDAPKSSTTLYQNNTTGGFSEAEGITLTSVYGGDAAWGDYDNDGDLDLALCGMNYEEVMNAVCMIYQNNGADGFSAMNNISLLPVVNSTVDWVDYDNDGDLDLLITGMDFGNYSKNTILYKNNLNIPNTAPSVPGNLSSTVTGSDVTFSWTAASDAETVSSNGLSYNIRVGTTSGGCDIVSPQSLASGKQLIPEKGKIQGLGYYLKNLSSGTYYWSVQAIDTGLTGGAFAAEQTFEVQ